MSELATEPKKKAGYRVLLIDYEPGCGDRIGAWFNQSGRGDISLLFERSVSDGLSRVNSDKIDVVLVGDSLIQNREQGMAERLGQLGTRLPVIVVSDKEFDPSQSLYLQQGFEDFLPIRSIDGAFFIGAIEKSVERKRSYLRSIQEINSNLTRLASPEILRKIECGANLGLETEQRLITALFADIRGFTTLSEKFAKEHVIKLLNHLLQEMTDSVLEEKGYLDKFLGDGLMALFGAPTPTDNDWLHAVRAAYKMQARIEIFNRRRRLEMPELTDMMDDIQVGVGIHCGTATVGFIGTNERCEYTAIGDCVNIASRLCSQARGGEILVTRVVADGVGAQGEFGDWRLVNLKGKSIPIEVANLTRFRL